MNDRRLRKGLRYRVSGAGVIALGVAALLAATACGTTGHYQARSNALEFLYPRGAEAVPPGDVTLRLPVRVGVAFAPAAPTYRDRFTANQKDELLERVAAAFRGKPGIAGVEVIPSGYLTPPAPPAVAAADRTVADGFRDLDRVRAAFGVDLVALLSYDQMQFSETGKSAWAYWTIVGIYLVKGEKNETQTMLDAVVYDIASRALLFHASGKSAIAGAATPVDNERVLRQRSDEGFSSATDDLIANLDVALGEFEKQAATGTVRGPGTPAIAMLGPDGLPIGGEGAAAAADNGGAFGPVEIAGLLLLVFLARRAARAADRRG